MFCTKCGAEVASDELFCWKCGSKLKKADTVKADTVKTELPRAEVPKVEIPREKLPTVKKSGLESIYLFNFVKSLFAKSNIPLCIYLLLNVIILGLFATLVFTLPVGWGMLAGLLIYIASIAVAISPIGEAIIRHQNNCKKIEDLATIQRLEPLFREVYYKAKRENPEISSDIRLFINEEKCPNAFATGRRTICVTRGLLDYPDDVIKAILAHEFGHLAHQDTDRILVVAIGNTAITAICLMFQFGALMMDFMMKLVAIFTRSEDGLFCAFMGWISSVITMVLIAAFMKVWTKLGVLLCMKTSRSNEYQADEFAYNLGYGNGLLSFFSGFSSEKPKGLFASLASSHPDNSDRIARLKALDAVALRG